MLNVTGGPADGLHEHASSSLLVEGGHKLWVLGGDERPARRTRVRRGGQEPGLVCLDVLRTDMQK
jgi:hypothetical protein